MTKKKPTSPQDGPWSHQVSTQNSPLSHQFQKMARRATPRKKHRAPLGNGHGPQAKTVQTRSWGQIFCCVVKDFNVKNAVVDLRPQQAVHTRPVAVHTRPVDKLGTTGSQRVPIEILVCDGGRDLGCIGAAPAPLRAMHHSSWSRSFFWWARSKATSCPDCTCQRKRTKRQEVVVLLWWFPTTKSLRELGAQTWTSDPWRFGFWWPPCSAVAIPLLASSVYPTQQ